MFTGIIEAVGEVTDVQHNGSNRSFRICSPISNQLKRDQSVSHDGVCLTVEQAGPDFHIVTAIEETLSKTSLSNWKPGKKVNLERCMLMNGRLDGHIVQGHVDGTAHCIQKAEKEGSWLFRFKFDASKASLVIEKGSITLNGISLTVFDVGSDEFSVAIIPYTYQHTNINEIGLQAIVNLEFDIIGKYMLRFQQLNS